MALYSYGPALSQASSGKSSNVDPHVIPALLISTSTYTSTRLDTHTPCPVLEHSMRGQTPIPDASTDCYAAAREFVRAWVRGCVSLCARACERASERACERACVRVHTHARVWRTLSPSAATFRAITI